MMLSPEEPRWLKPLQFVTKMITLQLDSVFKKSRNDMLEHFFSFDPNRMFQNLNLIDQAVESAKSSPIA